MSDVARRVPRHVPFMGSSLVSFRTRLAACGGAMSCIALLALPVMQASAADTKEETVNADTRQKLQAAQKRLDAAAREVADLSMTLSDDVMPRMMTQMRTMGRPRAVLGLNVGSPRDGDRADGVEVISVSPGGAAASAGIKAGDILTEVAGKPLKRDDNDSSREKLLAAMRDVKPDQKVTLKYLRDGKAGIIDAVAQPLEDRFFAMPAIPALPAIPGIPAEPMSIAPFAKFAFGRAAGVFGSAELVPLNAKLGQYFGADKGLLVVRAPEDARLKLEDGDVILDVDGRVPSSPTHALRILSSYQAGEKLKLNVLRMKKKLSFDITIPQGGEEGGTFERSNFVPGRRLNLIEATPFTAPAPALSPAPALGPAPMLIPTPVTVPLSDEPV
jgi:hypothetical protein